MRTCHSVSEPGGFKNPHTFDHSPGAAPSHHNGGGPGGTGEVVFWLTKPKARFERLRTAWAVPRTFSLCRNKVAAPDRLLVLVNFILRFV